MTDKSYVGMGQSICPVCTKKHNEVLLIDKRLKETLTKDEHMGFELCEEHKKLYDDNYICLVGIDENKSTQPYDIASVYRTGTFAHIRKEAFAKIFDMDVPNNAFNIALCPPEVFNILATYQSKEE